MRRERVDTFARFEMVEGVGFNLGAGEVLNLDIRGYSLRADFEKVDSLMKEVEANVTRMEERGFYTTSERHTIQRAKELVESSIDKLGREAYDDSFVDLRQAYLYLTGIRTRLETLMGEASVSVNILVAFVALTSLSTGYGLIYTRAFGGTPDAGGIMVMMPEYTPKDQFENGWFCPIVEVVGSWVAGNEGITSIAMKAENVPSLRPYASLDGWSIFGVIGVQPLLEPLMRSIDGVVAVGEPLREEGACLLHVLLHRQGGFDVGDRISIRGVPLVVAGFFDSGIRGVTDLDGGSILPDYQVNLTPGEEPTIVAMECETWEVVVTTLETALMIDRVLVSRIDASIGEGVDAEALGKSMSLSREYRFWVSDGGAVHLAYMGGLIGGKGLPLLVPWAIVVLNVVATMLSSMFERRREIDILSGIGLNPAHIAGVFLAEASILGVVAGGLGYLLGLGWYPLMAGLSIAPVVQQKVSAAWCLAAIGISMASVIVGSVIALRSSVVLTPSLRRRWALGAGPGDLESGWGVRVPLRLDEGEVDGFVEYVVGYLGFYDDRDRSPYLWSVRTGFDEGEGGPIRTVSFNFSEAGSSLKSVFATNRLTFAWDPEDGAYLVGLVCVGDQESAYRTGSFVRRMILDCTAKRRDDGQSVG